MNTSSLPPLPDPEPPLALAPPLELLLLLLLLLHAVKASAAVATTATADAIRRDRRMVNSFRRIRPRRRILCVGDCKAAYKTPGIGCHKLPSADMQRTSMRNLFRCRTNHFVVDRELPEVVRDPRPSADVADCDRA